MGCDCIPPPPLFDLPPPPDPSLVWHLLSDESVEELKQIQQCDSRQEIAHPIGISTLFTAFHFEYLPYLVIALGATLSTALIAMIIILRIRKGKSKERNQLKKKSDCSADVILRADRNWSYNSMKTDNGRGIMIYGPTDEVIMNKSMPVTPSSMRSLPRRPNNFMGPSPARNNLRQSATTLRLHGTADGYCTVGRTYEEIPVRRSDSETTFEDISAMHRRQLMYQQGDLQRTDMARKPPPNCRPPPPPSQGSPLSTESSINSFERELEQIHNTPSPKRSIEDDRKSRHSGENGRESGYGTAPSRVWNSPRMHHRQRELANRVDSQGRPMPLAVFAQQNNAHTMTYV
ncbi:unnamed protein product [Toxocara canis]|uniref:Lck-interacting transmembrane adapter 1 n=2 Tax=Toxocara canis TaxID=6265 RepID=A0A183UJ95_TOXCA|nr:unnamed protein product [Toxocara canis]